MLAPRPGVYQQGANERTARHAAEEWLRLHVLEASLVKLTAHQLRRGDLVPGNEPDPVGAFFFFHTHRTSTQHTHKKHRPSLWVGRYHYPLPETAAVIISSGLVLKKLVSSDNTVLPLALIGSRMYLPTTLLVAYTPVTPTVVAGFRSATPVMAVPAIPVAAAGLGLLTLLGIRKANQDRCSFA